MACQRKGMIMKTVKLGLFLKPETEGQKTDPGQSQETANLPAVRSSAAIRLKGKRSGLLVAILDGEVKTSFLQISAPFVDKGKIRPGRLTTTAAYAAECEWCGPWIASAYDIVAMASKKKDVKVTGARDAIKHLGDCPQCFKPMQKPWHLVDPIDEEGRMAFANCPPTFIEDCIEKTRRASGPFDLPAVVAAYPGKRDPVPPFSQTKRFEWAQANASSAVVRLKSGKVVEGLTLVDSDQLKPGVEPPIGWYLLMDPEQMGETQAGLITTGWRSGVNFKVDLRVLFGQPKPREGFEYRQLADSLDSLVI